MALGQAQSDITAVHGRVSPEACFIWLTHSLHVAVELIDEWDAVWDVELFDVLLGDVVNLS
eukprot:19159-Eustigmatos_ZCMA.PRE.1